MSIWAVYTRNEFNAAEEVEALGLTCHVPRKVLMVRKGNRRRPEPDIKPLLPNYIFVEGGAEEWHLAKLCKHVRSLTWCSPRESINVRRFIEAAEAEFNARMEEIERAQRVLMDREATKEQRKEALRAVQHFKAGEALEILDGAFKGRLAQFAGIVERGTSPELLLELELFGRTTTIRVDPLVAKKAVA